MNFSNEQVEALKTNFLDVSHFEDAGKHYFQINNLSVQVGSAVESLTALLCPSERDGYSSRLFFNRQFQVPHRSVNWNAINVRIGDQNWFAISYKIPADLTLVQMVATHLGAFR